MRLRTSWSSQSLVPSLEGCHPLSPMIVALVSLLALFRWRLLLHPGTRPGTRLPCVPFPGRRHPERGDNRRAEGRQRIKTVVDGRPTEAYPWEQPSPHGQPDMSLQRSDAIGEVHGRGFGILSIPRFVACGRTSQVEASAVRDFANSIKICGAPHSLSVPCAG